jgi:hypothetical protein
LLGIEPVFDDGRHGEVATGHGSSGQVWFQRHHARLGRADPEWVRHYHRGEIAWRVAEVFDGPDPVAMPGDEVAPVARYWVLLDGALPYRPRTAGTFGAVLSRFTADGTWWLTLPG